MRVLPLALWHQGSDESLVADAHTQSLPTHAHARSMVSCAYYCLVARGYHLPRTHYLQIQDAYINFRVRHFLTDKHANMAPDLLAIKLRTRHERLSDFTGLHIFVVTLRCEHSCPYCQVSRKSEDKGAFDMTESHADVGIELAFRSPAPSIKIEFQGGESLLNFIKDYW